jgi:hypothetical protein
MDEVTLLNSAGIPPEWLDIFVQESNKIDPQPGSSDVGTYVYDNHRQAVLYAIRMALEDRYALPREVHTLLLGGHPKAGVLRKYDTAVGFNDLMPHTIVARYMWDWNRRLSDVVDSLRVDDGSIPEARKRELLWSLHCELMNIRPYELFNGKTGRVLLINHALLVDCKPWLIASDKREAYFDVIRTHPSSKWAKNPPDLSAVG